MYGHVLDESWRSSRAVGMRPSRAHSFFYGYIKTCARSDAQSTVLTWWNKPKAPSRIKSANIAENARCHTRGCEFRAMTIDLSLFQHRRHQLGHLDIVAAATHVRTLYVPLMARYLYDLEVDTLSPNLSTNNFNGINHCELYWELYKFRLQKVNLRIGEKFEKSIIIINR